MMFLFVLTLVIAIFLAVALCVAALESSGGFLGDSSLVPAIIGAMLIAVGVIMFTGFLNGNIGVWVK